MAATMSDQPAATSGHDAPTAAATTAVTVEQAATILGVSVTTVKRRIRAGSLRAESVSRPQGTVWLVYLPTAATSAAEERPPAATVAATAPTTTPAAEAMVSLIQTTIGTVLGPLVGQLDAQRQTIVFRGFEFVQLEPLRWAQRGAVYGSRDAALDAIGGPRGRGQVVVDPDARAVELHRGGGDPG